MRGLWSTRRRRVWVVVASLLVALAALLAAAWLTSPAGTELPTRVQSRLRGTDGRAVPLSAVPLILREAVVATEDERFYQHQGIDLIGAIRALPYDLVHLSLAQGASTITEQVAKILYLQGNDRNLWRKLEDATVALKLEQHYSKEQILAAYLNSAYFGQHAYGIWAASEDYFATPPRRLNTAQATLLAGLIQAPTAYDPLVHPAAARARQVDVLRSMVRNGFLTASEAGRVLGAPLPLRHGRPLAATTGIDLSPGPAFTWWQLGVGAFITFCGLSALIVLRAPRFSSVHGLLAAKIVSVVLLIFGAAVVIRSFRNA